MPLSERSSQPRRCSKCFYILDHLESRNCPECGRPFDPSDPSTFVTKPPFVWWTFWLPAFLLAGVGGGILWGILILYAGFTVSTTFVVPIMIGAVVGYAGTVRIFYRILIALAALGAAIGILASGQLLGGFCGAIVGCLVIIPVLGGVLMGYILRRILINSNFSQSAYLRSILLQMLCILIPVIAVAIEGRHPIMAPVVVQTTTVINAPPMQAWHGIQFFEEVHRPVPWLLLLSPQLRPMYTIGHSEKVGDLKTCVYQKGKLVKQITEVVPGKRLAFRVVEQDRIEVDGATLLDGSFDLESIDGGQHTRVVLSTRYLPKLQPRIAYAWAESLAIHTLHGHVLAGMKDTAEEQQQ